MFTQTQILEDFVDVSSRWHEAVQRSWFTQHQKRNHAVVCMSISDVRAVTKHSCLDLQDRVAEAVADDSSIETRTVAERLNMRQRGDRHTIAKALINLGWQAHRTHDGMVYTREKWSLAEEQNKLLLALAAAANGEEKICPRALAAKTGLPYNPYQAQRVSAALKQLGWCARRSRKFADRGKVWYTK